MTRASRIIRCAASVAALSALTMFDAAVANHFIRPCGDNCRGSGWVATGSMRSARELHTATLLANGRFAVAGGVSNDNVGPSCCTATATVEIYDPATRAWSHAGVCRFWSGQSFARKSSHLYTPYADECAKLMHDTVWMYERHALYVAMPGGTPGARTCPLGTRPRYRAYNNGMGDAPNHRYTTDPAVLDAMIAQGWIMEGEAATRVFACMPQQD